MVEYIYEPPIVKLKTEKNIRAEFKRKENESPIQQRH